MFLQGFNVILAQNSMLTVWNFGFFFNSVSGPVVLGPVWAIGKTGPSMTGPETEYKKRPKFHTVSMEFWPSITLNPCKKHVALISM